MESQPLVSIIIPCYNKGNLIFDAIKSIFLNDYSKVEILVVNDGSTDKVTINTLNTIRKKPKIIIINKKNGGLSSARNAGLDKAKGKYILFLDHDDLISKNFIRESVKFLEKNEDVDFVYPDIIFFGEQKNLKFTPRYNGDKLNINNYIPCSCVHRSSVVKKMRFDESLPALEDWDFLLQLKNKGHKGSKPSSRIFLYYRIIAATSMNVRFSKISAMLRRNKIIQKIRKKRLIKLSTKDYLVYYLLFFAYPLGHLLAVRKETKLLDEYLKSKPGYKKELLMLGILE